MDQVQKRSNIESLKMSVQFLNLNETQKNIMLQKSDKAKSYFARAIYVS